MPMKKMLRTFFVTLVVIGLVIGVWRFLGDGADITDPEWPQNVYENVQEWFAGADSTVRDRTDSMHAPQFHDGKAS